MTNHTYTVVNGRDLSPEKLDGLMRRCFSTTKSDFLRDHGDWRHHGNEHRYVVVQDDGEQVGYFASIPVEVLFQGEPRAALWWMDLFVPPEYRGRGIQRVTDQAARQMADLHLGFPNHVAAAIHQKHGWGVRSDYRVVMLPLQPTKLPHIREAAGWKSYARLAAAWALMPVAWGYRRWLAAQSHLAARRVEDPTAEFLADVFRKQDHRILTTNRTADYLRWRYLESPHRQQLLFFTSGAEQAPALAAVTRSFMRQGVKIARILDVFGNLSDTVALTALLRRIVVEMSRQKAVYITAMVTRPELVPIFRAVGFVFSVSSRFRWFSPDPEEMRLMGETPGYWCLGDSDNDSID